MQIKTNEYYRTEGKWTDAEWLEVEVTAIRNGRVEYREIDAWYVGWPQYGHSHSTTEALFAERFPILFEVNV